MPVPLSPTTAQERIQSLDLLRGIAVLGILLMNVQSLSMPGAAYLNPTAYGNLEGMNYWVWVLSHLFADQKFMTLFSVLFGAGMLLVSDRMEQKSQSPLTFHLKRNFWLLIIGLVHAYLIWYGDILVVYALCSFLVFWVRNKSPRTLLIIGLLVLSIPTLINLFFSVSLQFMPPDVVEELELGWHPSPEMIAEELAAVTGSLAAQIAHNAQAALEMHTFVFVVLFLWRASGLMVIGMALYKWDILTASRSTSFYRKGMLLGFSIGIPLTVYGIVQNFHAGWSMDYSLFTGASFNYWGSLAQSFGYLCAVMLFSKSAAAAGIKRRLAAIGQMALTNYIAQSIIGVFIFYGVGLGLFGQVDRTTQVCITLGIWMLQYIWSKPWLDSFRFGPLEWVWRSLTYGKAQPIKKS
ncbi:uncharacterized protein SAMN05192553_10927 [Cyclobacterium xiamenense]|uniref:DUF418 domain-containing protein n=1 Tax=Cyclobacterium xiamenense TaxID=1297121 RepID=A0A1H7AZD5_9BACT|nr:DUF418 domain-containing protein [Cyclobacterium xiamenense]SEJ70618.1 uncharacterized protein SAMN05192553_10927 [Cyclobacterium xiamenense]